ncbi:uncharacterized protein G2W53_029176 [Senna tora]|uniref:Uncharacterized protein n=1 Tax=Senna tora TaxID=362788 RepID=A0A834T779_9FABA|nr:uncharacterized protein G2W53_029176 [Senna tora]
MPAGWCSIEEKHTHLRLGVLDCSCSAAQQRFAVLGPHSIMLVLDCSIDLVSPLLAFSVLTPQRSACARLLNFSSDQRSPSPAFCRSPLCECVLVGNGNVGCRLAAAVQLGL